MICTFALGPYQQPLPHTCKVIPQANTICQVQKYLLLQVISTINAKLLPTGGAPLRVRAGQLEGLTAPASVLLPSRDSLFGRKAIAGR